MKNVAIYTFDNAADPTAYTETAFGYQFIQASPPAPKINNKSNYKLCVGITKKLNGWAILVVDLKYEEVAATETFLKRHHEAEHVATIFGALADADNRDSVPPGWCLVYEALKNANWKGSILICTNNMAEGEIRNTIAALPGIPSRRVVIGAGGGRIRGEQSTRYKEAIELFLAKFGSILYRLNPDDCRGWFSSEADLIPHNWSDFDKKRNSSQLRTKAREAIQEYFGNLFDAHEEADRIWLSAWINNVLADDAVHASAFWNVLKRLVGNAATEWSSADPALKEQSKLTYGCLAIILAICSPNRNVWLPGLCWKEADMTELYCGNVNGREVLKSLVNQGGLFFTVCIHKQAPHSATIDNVHLEKCRLELDFSFPDSNAQGTILSKVADELYDAVCGWMSPEPGGHDAREGYTKLLETLRVNTNERCHPRFAVGKKGNAKLVFAPKPNTHTPI